MSDVISLDQYRGARAVHGHTGGGAVELAGALTVTFAFDLASAWTYLAAERVERSFPGATWMPVAVDPPRHVEARMADHSLVAARAAALRMPLVWPERTSAGGRKAMRVAAWAAGLGQAPAFVLAAGRLAFCGGFDLDDPETLVEAAAAAGLGADACLRASDDVARDAEAIAAGCRLLAEGVDRLPAVRVGRLQFCGEERIAAALAATRDPQQERGLSPRDGRAG